MYKKGDLVELIRVDDGDKEFGLEVGNVFSVIGHTIFVYVDVKVDLYNGGKVSMSYALDETQVRLIKPLE